MLPSTRQLLALPLPPRPFLDWEILAHAPWVFSDGEKLRRMNALVDLWENLRPARKSRGTRGRAVANRNHKLRVTCSAVNPDPVMPIEAQCIYILVSAKTDLTLCARLLLFLALLPNTEILTYLNAMASLAKTLRPLARVAVPKVAARRIVRPASQYVNIKGAQMSSDPLRTRHNCL